jgi:hypothetical protein
MHTHRQKLAANAAVRALGQPIGRLVPKANLSLAAGCRQNAGIVREAEFDSLFVCPLLMLL